MFPKNRRPLRRRRYRCDCPRRLRPTAPASACALGPRRRYRHARRPAYPCARAAVRRRPADHGSTNAIPLARCHARASKRRYPNACVRHHAHAPTYPLARAANLSPRRRRLHAYNRRQSPCLRAARKRRYRLLGARP